MRNLSTEFKEQQNSGNRNYLKYADFTFTDGSTLSITDKDLWSNGFKFEDAVSQSGSFDIGAAIVNKLTLQINNFSGKYTDYIWDGARVVCHIGLELSTGIEKIRICTMTVTDAPYQSTAIISLTCEDSMRKFDRDYSDSKLTYPATRLQIIQDACEVCGVTLQSTRFDNDDFVIQNRPDDSSITFRQVIAWVAQMGCQWAKTDTYGRLCLDWYKNEVPENFYNKAEVPWNDIEGKDILDTAGAQIITVMQKGITAIDTNGFTPWLYDLEITGIKVTEYVENSSKNEAKTYQSGKTGYVIEISDNKLIQEGSGEKICQIIADRCVGLKFRPFTTGALTNIAWEAGDTIEISDRNGKQYKSFLTSVALNPGAFEQLECSAKSVSRNKQKQYTLNQQVQAENKKNLKDERTAREKALEELSQRLAESSGTYTTVETQPDGSKIYYLHNKPQLSDSDIIWKMTAEAWAVSTDGGQHWNGGMTVDGDVIARILTATGINADWINTGTIVGERINGRGIKVIDDDKNVTLEIDSKGNVTLAPKTFSLQGKTVKEIADSSASTAVSGQTQADIFNKLTNGGKAQGIYLDENGNVYVNGEYVQAKGIKVVDSNGKTTFAIDKTTGAVTIAASQFTLGDKSVADIAQEEAIKQVQDITSDNIIKGYYLTEQNVKDYWSTQSAYTYEYGIQDIDGGKNAIKINGYTAQFGTKNYKPIKTIGNYTFSFWIKTSISTQVNVSIGDKTVLRASTTTEWQRMQVTATLSALPKDSVNSLRIIVSAVSSNVKFDTYIYMPKLEYAYTNEQVFNMLTNNGAIKGMYMENGELYFSFTYAHGGTLKLGGSNNGNGLLSILNASGTQVGYIDNTGVHFNQGEFSGSVKSLTGEIGNWQIDKTNGKLTSANGAIVLDAKNNMVSINGVNLKANGNGFIIDGGVKIKNTTDSSGFADETSFFCLENLGAITDGTHLGVNSQGMVIKVPSSSWRYKSIRTTVKEEELEELYRTKVVWAKYKEGYLDKNDSRYDKLMPMFLAEDMERRFPIAVNHLPDGKPEDWNYRIMIPSMFAMIKFNHEKIKELKSENEELKSELKSIKEELAEIKKMLIKQ
jgi:hypothetical protein